MFVGFSNFLIFIDLFHISPKKTFNLSKIASISFCTYSPVIRLVFSPPIIHLAQGSTWAEMSPVLVSIEVQNLISFIKIKIVKYIVSGLLQSTLIHLLQQQFTKHLLLNVFFCLFWFCESRGLGDHIWWRGSKCYAITRHFKRCTSPCLLFWQRLSSNSLVILKLNIIQ